jgi:4-hydroxy-L-threonine phosphate dehydrogenase PdxA
MARAVRVGLLLGDPCGIGPELVARLLTGGELDPDTATIVIGEPRILARGAQHAGIELRLPEASSADAADPGTVALLRGPSLDLAAAPVGQASAAAGAYVLDAFRQALGLVRVGALDALCFAPCNKQAMHAGGLAFEDELRFFAHELGCASHVGEINATGDLATTRVTSHVPLRAVAELITEDGVLAATRLADATLRAAGKPHPRIAVAGLNPHAGDGGVFGREEIEVIAPAIARARADRRVGALPRRYGVRARQRRRLRRGGHHVPRPGSDRDEAHGFRARHHDPRWPAGPGHHARARQRVRHRRHRQRPGRCAAPSLSDRLPDGAPTPARRALLIGKRHRGGVRIDPLGHSRLDIRSASGSICGPIGSSIDAVFSRGEGHDQGLERSAGRERALRG